MSHDTIVKTDCEYCAIESDLFIRLCPLHSSAPELLAALKEVGNACNVCAAQDNINQDYWFKKQRIVDAAIAYAEGRL